MMSAASRDQMLITAVKSVVIEHARQLVIIVATAFARNSHQNGGRLFLANIDDVILDTS